MISPKTLISLFVLSMIVAVGIYLYRNTSPSQQSVTTSPTNTPASTPTTAIMEAQIAAKVLQFYKEYAQFNEGGLDTLYQTGYLTENSYQELKKPHPLDPVLCTQGGSQSPFEIDSVMITGQTATIVMKQYFEGSKTYNYSKVGVALPDQKITSITCNYTK